MNPPSCPLQIEPRWPVALTILIAIGLVTVLPDRVSLLPDWVPSMIGAVLLVPLLAVSLARVKSTWLRIEQTITLGFCLVVGVANLISLSYLIDEMINASKVLDGLQLLTSSITIWVTNVLVFSLLYWQIDRGGSEARTNTRKRQPDWLFPQTDQSDDGSSGWQPTFIDYLFLSYTTTTAFSPTDTLPLTPRAKLLMLIESGIALVTTVAVISRAINILGS